MNNLDNLIKEMSENENDKILKTFEPLAIALHTINKESKKERDKIKEMSKSESDKHSKYEIVHQIFKIKDSTLKKGIVKTMDVEFDCNNPDGLDDVLVDKMTEKLNHPFALIVSIGKLNSVGLITEDLKTDYIKTLLQYINKYYSEGKWKENIDKLPKINKSDIKNILNSLKQYFKPFKSNDEITKHIDRKNELYDKKDKFLNLLNQNGLMASEMHYFVTPYGNVYNNLPYVTYGGFGFHTKNFAFVDKESTLKEGYIEGEISAESPRTIDANIAEKALDDAIEVLEQFNNKIISFDEAVNKANDIIENNNLKNLIIENNKER